MQVQCVIRLFSVYNFPQLLYENPSSVFLASSRGYQKLFHLADVGLKDRVARLIYLNMHVNSEKLWTRWRAVQNVLRNS